MPNYALYVGISARQGRENELLDLLRRARILALEEQGVTEWYAVRSDRSAFAIFVTTASEAARSAYLRGRSANLLRDEGASLLAEAPSVVPIEVVAGPGVRHHAQPRRS